MIDRFIISYGSEAVVYAWLIAALIFLVLELTSPGLFVSLAFAIGACVGALAAWGDYSFMAQCYSALAGCLMAFVVLRRWYAARSHGAGDIKTNVSALIGEQAMVLEEVALLRAGSVKIGGERWPAKTDLHEPIGRGTVVKVIRVEGNHVVVTRR